MERSIAAVLERALQEMGLGELAAPPEKLTGGLMHTMYAAVTDKGKYAIKILNPSVMLREKALRNTILSECVARELRGKVPAVPAICKDGEAILALEGGYYMAFPWQAGKSVFAKDITPAHCEKIGNILGAIHSAEIQIDGLEHRGADAPGRDWEYFLQLAKTERPAWQKLFTSNYERICGWARRSEDASKQLGMAQVISHRDLDPKNVLWEGMAPYLIDWEAAGYVNPDQELVEAVNDWASNRRGGLDRGKACALVSSYQAHRAISRENLPAAVDSGFDGMLGWLAYNMNRSLGIECSSEEERHMGEKQVKGTIRALRAYEKKADLLLEWIGAFADG